MTLAKAKPGAPSTDFSETRTLSRLLGTAALLVVVAQGCSTMSGTSMAPAPESGAAVVNVTSAPALPMAPKESAVKPSAIHVGEASWYGPGFSGKPTASGDVFDETKLTAAHKTIPLGTKAKVTNLQNGKSVEVEINDRGPYTEGRIIDLSQAAAKSIGIIHRGVAKVRVEVLEREMALGEVKP